MIEVDMQHAEGRIVFVGDVDGGLEGPPRVLAQRIANGHDDQRHVTEETVGDA